MLRTEYNRVLGQSAGKHKICSTKRYGNITVRHIPPTIVTTDHVHVYIYAN